MALGSNHITGTGGTHDKYVPEVWAKRAQLAFEENTIAKENAKNLTDLVSTIGGDAIHVPKQAKRTATTRALTAGDQITPASSTEDEFSMNVQTWALDKAQVSFALPEQTRIYQLADLETAMNKAVLRKFDSDLLAQQSSFTPTARGTDDGVSVPTLDDFIGALEDLHINDVPMEDVVLLLGPKTYYDLLRSDVITNSDFGTGMGKETGRIPMIAGRPVKVSTNIPDSANGSETNHVISREALAYALAQPLRIDAERAVSWMSDVYIANMIYGVGVYRPEAATAVWGR